MLAPFSSAYLAGDPRARAFLPARFADPDDRRRAARSAAARAAAPELLAALRDEDRELPASAARARHLDALATPGTAAVVTGQQVGLFLGPLYTVYKAAAAVAAARALEGESGVRCVPIFWLQTEDHDLAEIDHCVVPGPGGAPLELRLPPGAAAVARASVAHHRLGAEVEEPLAALAAALGDAPHAPAVLELLRRHYRPGASLPRAFAGVLAELFAAEGLVVLDPRHPAIAAAAAPLHRAALERCDDIAAALAARGRALADAGFATQVPVRPGTTLSFFHADGPAGPRYRLERQGAAWALPGADRALGADEVLATLAREPLRFSTSALLRPVVQDALLPTAAYVGGPGEINYFGQLGPLYALLGVPLPLIVPRARFRLLDDHTRALLGKLALRAADAEAPRAEVLRRATAALAASAAAGGPVPPSAAAITARLLAAVEPPLAELEGAHPSLRDPVRKARDTFARTAGKLGERYAQALLERDRVTAARVDRLQQLLFPGGSPQERVYALPGFAARHGARALVARLGDGLVPFDPEPRDLDL